MALHSTIGSGGLDLVPSLTHTVDHHHENQSAGCLSKLDDLKEKGDGEMLLIDPVSSDVHSALQDFQAVCGDGRSDCFETLLSSEAEPKRFKLDHDHEEGTELSLKQILKNIHKAITLRLDSIEQKMDVVTNRCQCLEGKMDLMATQFCESGIKLDDYHSQLSSAKTTGTQLTVSSNMAIVTLNSENDYPNGTWLGDENNPEMRVRCPISISDLAFLNRNCHTPEKMALTLLDYLFDRSTQACSNISGHGKHGKKQLDPLFIYGIKCHLIQKFGINEQDWQRIKLNLDSKCRTAFRRKLRGMPLTVKAFRDKLPPSAYPMSDADTQDASQGSNTNDDLVANCVLSSDRSESSALNDMDASVVFSGKDSGAVKRPTMVSEGESSSTGDPLTLKTEDGVLDMVSHHFNADEMVNPPMITLGDKEAFVNLVESQEVAMELGLVGLDDQSQVSYPHLDLVVHGGHGLKQMIRPSCMPQIIHTLQGGIQVLQATPEQIAEIQRAGKLQIFTGSNFLAGANDVLNLTVDSTALSSTDFSPGPHETIECKMEDETPKLSSVLHDFKTQ